jgi:hypothetical protein
LPAPEPFVFEPPPLLEEVVVAPAATPPAPELEGVPKICGLAVAEHAAMKAKATASGA